MTRQDFEVVPGVHLEITINPRFNGNQDETVAHHLALVVTKKVGNVHDPVLGTGEVIERGSRESSFPRMYNRVRNQVPYRNS